MPDLPRIALVGIHGFGAVQRRAIAEHEASGRARLVALVDPVAPDASGAGGPVPGEAAAWFPDLGSMLAGGVRPDVVVVATPIHTHTELAARALRAGADVLLEKPPTASLVELDQLLGTESETGQVVQVGFQTFGSAALDLVHDVVASGEIGTVTAVGGLGTWVRPESYWTRSAWAGRRTLGGRPVVDGVVTNPLAHTVATALHLAGARTTEDVADVETDLYRANDIEGDDTSVVRITTRTGVPVTLALTVCAPVHRVPEVTVRGTRGSVLLDYYADTVTVTVGDVARTEHAARTHLLTNLLDHRADPGVPLMSPLRGTGAFMRVLDAVRSAPDPGRIAAEHVRTLTDDAGTHRVVVDVEAWCRRAVELGATFAELGAPFTGARSTGARSTGAPSTTAPSTTAPSTRRAR